MKTGKRNTSILNTVKSSS